MGRYLAPEAILLFELPLPPWRVPALISERDALRCRRAGAQVEFQEATCATVLEWPADSLRDFCRFEVLLHEVGHHMLQYHKGKRKVRIARRKDHEAFADRFVEQCRSDWIGNLGEP